MGDLHFQYVKSRSIVTAYKGGWAHPHIKLKKLTLVARFSLLSFLMALAGPFEGFHHFHPLTIAAHPESSFLTLGEGLGGTLS